MHGASNSSSSTEVLSETTLMSNRMSLGSQSENNGYYNNSGTSSGSGEGPSTFSNGGNNGGYRNTNYDARKGKGQEMDTMANLATASTSDTSGILTALTTYMTHANWIIDTGASNHMVHNFSLISQSTNLDVKSNMKVNLPTGDQVSISHVGESLVLKNKLYVSYSKLAPTYRASLAAYFIIAEPHTYIEACQDPYWVDVMRAEITALEENDT
ncbi:hypothetical protein H5410_049936 [Solanum commersonii]|uniref:Uncharacterized protein n=1 Tax=Solanum commersonii TaxID=4109 RepID=A0A9J5WVL2_SOLCO|nr:hypothetical protein H5410_049936 [Solanum commersonii]